MSDCTAEPLRHKKGEEPVSPSPLKTLGFYKNELSGERVFRFTYNRGKC